MTRMVWRAIIAEKSFYIKGYRWLLSMIIISLLLSLLLCVAIGYVYFHQKPNDFYATNGVMLPIQLRAFDVPNYTSEHWLQPDPMIPSRKKLIPE